MASAARSRTGSQGSGANTSSVSFLDNSVFSSPNVSRVDCEIFLPIVNEEINELRSNLLKQDNIVMKHIRACKETVEKKTALQEAFLMYQTSFSKLTSAYLTLAAQITTANECKKAVIKACAGITRNCTTGVIEALNKHPVAQKPVQEKSFAAIVKQNKVHVPKGPTVEVKKSVNFIIAPKADSATKYESSSATKKAVTNLVKPAEVGLQVERISGSRNNGIRIQANKVDLDKIRAHPALAKAGLEVVEDLRYNPRVIIYGVSKDLTKEEIRSDFINLNLSGTDDKLTKVVYIYPPRDGKAYTNCVLEVSPKTRAAIKDEQRIYIGLSACRFDDHVKVAQCYKCLGYGHQARDCKSAARCGHCSGDHEMRDCNKRDKPPCCRNCKSAGTDSAHTALDGTKCPILKRRILDKVRMTNYG